MFILTKIILVKINITFFYLHVNIWYPIIYVADRLWLTTNQNKVFSDANISKDVQNPDQIMQRN